jgi:hypothetical protein
MSCCSVEKFAGAPEIEPIVSPMSTQMLENYAETRNKREKYDTAAPKS